MPKTQTNLTTHQDLERESIEFKRPEVRKSTAVHARNLSSLMRVLKPPPSSRNLSQPNKQRNQSLVNKSSDDFTISAIEKAMKKTHSNIVSKQKMDWCYNTYFSKNQPIKHNPKKELAVMNQYRQAYDNELPQI